jgi:hypothetical protein
MTAAIHPNALPAVRNRLQTGAITWDRTLFMLLFRSLGFLAVQAAIALIFLLAGRPDPWEASIAWWPLAATVVSLATLAMLVWATGREGLRYVDLLSARRDTLLADIGWFLLVSLLAGPISFLPMQWLSAVLFGDPQAAGGMMFRALPGWAAIILFIAFPLTVALTELPLYFGYVMPRLEALSGKTWLAVLLPAIFLAAQHCALPLIFDWRFVAWRAVMFLPFALLLGIALRLRPSLMPYLIVGHFLIDLSSAYFFVAIS